MGYSPLASADAFPLVGSRFLFFFGPPYFAIAFPSSTLVGLSLRGNALILISWDITNGVSTTVLFRGAPCSNGKVSAAVEELRRLPHS
jgi:hypothetical protein